jgi:hypothetical protein
VDETFPEAVEADEEFDFLAPDEGADGFHVAFAAGALERVAAPDFEDEVTPEGRMWRALRLGGAGIRWIWVDVGGFEGSLVFT